MLVDNFTAEYQLGFALKTLVRLLIPDSDALVGEQSWVDH